MLNKYDCGDLVQIKGDFPEFCKHFVQNKRAIVLYDYNTRCYHSYDSSKNETGNPYRPEYSLLIEDMGEHAWYGEWQIELIEKKRLDLLGEWLYKENSRLKKQLNYPD